MFGDGRCFSQKHQSWLVQRQEDLADAGPQRQVFFKLSSPGRYRPFFTGLKGRCITLMLQGNLKSMNRMIRKWYPRQDSHLIRHLRRVSCFCYTTGILSLKWRLMPVMLRLTLFDRQECCYYINEASKVEFELTSEPNPFCDRKLSLLSDDRCFSKIPGVSVTLRSLVDFSDALIYLS